MGGIRQESKYPNPSLDIIMQLKIAVKKLVNKVQKLYLEIWYL